MSGGEWLEQQIAEAHGWDPDRPRYSEADRRWEKTRAILSEVEGERRRQHAKWGEQNHPDGTGPRADIAEFILSPEEAKTRCENAFKRGLGTYAEILNEEFCEALGEADKTKLRAELIQVAAVAVAWIEKLDREVRR